MKIQCHCGQKYAFEVTPEMATNPIRFVCQSCGMDSSELVNQLIRQELAAGHAAPTVSVRPASPPSPTPPPEAAARLTPPVPPSPPKASASSSPGLRVAPAATAHAHTPAPARTPAASPSEAKGTAGAVAAAHPVCTRHPGELSAHECLVCHKPMCPQCMRITGLVCSPLCRSKAETQGVVVPEYADQRDVADRRRWRKVSLVVGAIAAVLLAVFGFWFWYAWFGSVPKVVYSHRYVNPGYSGGIHLAANQQLVVLHGGTLEKHQLEPGSVAWSVELIDRDRIARDSVAELEEMKKRREEAIREGADRDAWRLPTLDALTKANLRSAAAAFNLHVSGENIWLVTDDKLTRYGWTDGKPDKEIEVDPGFNEPVRAGDELVFSTSSPWFATESTETERSLRVNLATGESKATGSTASGRPALAANRSGQKPRAVLAGTGTGTNNPATQGQARSKALNPAAVARQAQNLPMPNRLALPATLAAAENQRRTQAMLDEDTDALVVPRAVPRKPGVRPSTEQIRRIPTPEGVVELGVRLLEEKIVTREAMKERPKKSALEGTVNAAATTDIANEIFNEMQRDREGSTVQEDESRYQFTVRRADRSIASWTGEVVGHPSLHSLKSVDVVVAGKALIVLNRSNKKLWEGKLSNALPGGAGVDGSDLLAASADAASAHDGRLTAGVGPLVERAETLYVCDQGMLTSFGLSDGTVRWRLPSVGISGLWFDAAGLIYVNTTTGSPDSLKYSKQIDISTKTQNQVLKVDPKTGRTLWAAHNEGLVTYLWNDYIYTVESSAGPEDDEDAGMGMPMGLAIPAHIRLKRLDATNGRVRWEHYQPRYPLDVHFDRNTIQLLFRKEVQNLRFIVL